jgi:hypothetical protein
MLCPLIRLSKFVFPETTIYGQLTLYGHRLLFEGLRSGLSLTLFGDLGGYQTEKGSRYRAGAEC